MDAKMTASVVHSARFLEFFSSFSMRPSTRLDRTEIRQGNFPWKQTRKKTQSFCGCLAATATLLTIHPLLQTAPSPFTCRLPEHDKRQK